MECESVVMSSRDYLHGWPTSDVPLAEPKVGDLLDQRYELLAELGRGGTGRVWRARDLPGRREVAVKLLNFDSRHEERAIERVRDVFQRVHRLTHENIGKTLALEFDRRLGAFVVMDLIDGVSLRRHLLDVRQRRQPITEHEVAKLLRPIAAALDYAHREGVVHRDVKPENILISVAPHRKSTLIDFGLAAATRGDATDLPTPADRARGTLPYMSPEQLAGDCRAAIDQYALAVVAYEILAGALPFGNDSHAELIRRIRHQQPALIPSVSKAANRALLKALEKAPQDRFPSCGRFIDALIDQGETSRPSPANAGQGESARSRAPSSPSDRDHRPRAARKKVARPALVAILLVASLIGFGAYLAHAYLRPNRVTEIFPDDSAVIQRFHDLRAAAPQRIETWMTFPCGTEAARLAQESAAREIDMPLEWTNRFGMRMRLIPPGEFEMGGDIEDDEKPKRRVRITRPFYLGVHEVTRAQYRRVIGLDPSHSLGSENDHLPADSISWLDAQTFLKRLTELSSGVHYRLPTEAQWEYACRAGTSGSFWFGEAFDDTLANAGYQRPGITPVGAYRANPFGLHDQHGNVWEWCRDGYHHAYYQNGPASDPENVTPTTERVARGGSWCRHVRYCRSMARNRFASSNREFYVGFRVAVELFDVEQNGPSIPDAK